MSNLIDADSAWCKRSESVANEFVASPNRELPDFPCVMQDAAGNTYTCNDLNAFDAMRSGGKTLVAPKAEPKPKAVKKKASKKKASKKG